jgi:hypothetical protein
MNNADTIHLLQRAGWLLRIRHSFLRRRQMRSLAAAIRRGAFVAAVAR